MTTHVKSLTMLVLTVFALQVLANVAAAQQCPSSWGVARWRYHDLEWSYNGGGDFSSYMTGISRVLKNRLFSKKTGPELESIASGAILRTSLRGFHW